jgi:Phospholipase_D-nuclease N-terminal
MKNAIVYLILIAGCFLSCTDKQPEITSADFQRLLLADSIQSISVFNDESVSIVTKSPDFDGDKYMFKINSSDQFRRKLDILEREYLKTHADQPYTSISYVSGSSNFRMMGMIELGLLTCILALFLISAIDILRSRFVSDVEKLIWIVVVIFVPIIGPIFYLLIGRKQKVKFDK